MKKALCFVVLLVLLCISPVLAYAADNLEVIAIPGYPFFNAGGHEKKFPSTKAAARSGYTGFIASWDDVGTWVDWVIDVPAAGEYVFFARYATGEDCDAARSLEVRLGQDAPYIFIDSIRFPEGGNWGSEGWLLLVGNDRLTLRPGSNFIRMTVKDIGFEQTGLNVVNLGFVKVESGSVVPNESQIIEAVDKLLYVE